jgi:hypothetical protein
MYAHKSIKRFHISGTIYDDSLIIRLKEKYIKILKDDMEHQGYVIRFDIDPDFTLEYNGKTFDFILSVYGVYVGKRKAQCLDGIDKNREVRSTPKSRLKEVSRGLA